MIVEDSKDLSAYEVVGPNGEYYGRYEERPSADKIPLYAMVRDVQGLGQEGTVPTWVKLVPPLAITMGLLGFLIYLGVRK